MVSNISSTDAPTSTLIYDESCRLCQATRRWLMTRDRHHRLEFKAAQTLGIADEFPQLAGRDLLREITFVRPDGELLGGSDAIAAALCELPRWNWLGQLIAVPIVAPFRVLIYRWIANHRYTWFGKDCESGCTLDSRAKPALPVETQTVHRTLPTIVSLAILLLVLSPITQNFKGENGEKIDSFPLSYFPMFSAKRDAIYKQRSVIGVRSNGENFPIHYRLLGSGGLNSVRRQLDKLARSDDTSDLDAMLQRVAERIRESSKKKYQDCVELRAVRGHYDLQGYFSENRKAPVKLELIATCPVRTDPINHSDAEERTADPVTLNHQRSTLTSNPRGSDQ